MAVIDAFESGVADLQLGVFEAGRQTPVLAPDPLAFHQQGQPGFKVQLSDVALVTLFFEGLSHAFQAQGLEFFQRLSVKHKAECFFEVSLSGRVAPCQDRGPAIKTAYKSNAEAVFIAGANPEGIWADGSSVHA